MYLTASPMLGIAQDAANSAAYLAGLKSINPAPRVRTPALSIEQESRMMARLEAIPEYWIGRNRVRAEMLAADPANSQHHLDVACEHSARYLAAAYPPVIAVAAE